MTLAALYTRLEFLLHEMAEACAELPMGYHQRYSPALQALAELLPLLWQDANEEVWRAANEETACPH